MLFKTERLQFSDDYPIEDSGPLYKHWLSLIPKWMINYINFKIWNEITDPFLNLNGATVEVQEWRSNFIPYFNRHVIFLSMLDKSWNTLVKGKPPFPKFMMIYFKIDSCEHIQINFI